MSKFTDDLTLLTASYSPLTTKGSALDVSEHDDNFVFIRKDFESLSFTADVAAYDSGTTYDDTDNRFATNGGKTWQWINATPGSGVTPADGIYWQEVFPAIMAHPINRDTYLDKGGANEISAADIVAGLAAADATTNLGITTKTDETFKITSSTGADVTVPAATQKFAGLMVAADKIKVDQLSGTNTGDQTLESLGAEATANKATNFDTLNDTLFPTVQAVATYIASLIRVESFQVICGTKGADIAVATGVGFFRVPYDFDATAVNITVLTAPTGDDITADVLLNGVSVLGTAELTIDATEFDSDNSAVSVTLVTTQWDKGDIITIDVTGVGATIAGKDLIFTVLGTKRIPS